MALDTSKLNFGTFINNAVIVIAAIGWLEVREDKLMNKLDAYHAELTNVSTKVSTNSQDIEYLKKGLFSEVPEKTPKKPMSSLPEVPKLFFQPSYFDSKQRILVQPTEI